MIHIPEFLKLRYIPANGVISPMRVTSPAVFDVKLCLSFKSILYDSKFLNCINVVINLRNCQAIHLHSLTGVIKHQSCKSTYVFGNEIRKS